MKNAPIKTVGFIKKEIIDVIWDNEKQVAFYMKSNIGNQESEQYFLFKGQDVNINEYRGYCLNNCSYFDYRVDIYGVGAKKLLNISRDYWNIDFENNHADYLKELFDKHISNLRTAETDLLKLTYCADYDIDFELSSEWENYSIGNYRISDILEGDGFYIIDIDIKSNNYEYQSKNIKSLFDDYLFLEIKSDRDSGLIYALKNHCKKQGYNSYRLKNINDAHIQSKDLGLEFLGKLVSPVDKYSDLLWEVVDYYKETEVGNIFESLWNDLNRDTIMNIDFFSISYLHKSSDKLDLLKNFDKLFFKHLEYWDELVIFSPYQFANNNIEMLDLDQLSAYVANKKNDLANVSKYKDLYQKLVVEIDKYKKSPH